MNFKELKDLYNEFRERGKGFYYKKILDILSTKNYQKVSDLKKVLMLDKPKILKMLYRLFDLGFVDYKKTEDGEYIWTYKTNSVEWKIKQQKLRRIMEIKEKLESKSEQIYYVCENCKISLNYFDALENKFKCTKCKKDMKFFDEDDYLTNLKKELNKLMEQINNDEEISINAQI